MAFYNDSKPGYSGFMEDVVDLWSKNVHPMEERGPASFQVTVHRCDQHFAYFRPKNGLLWGFSHPPTQRNLTAEGKNGIFFTDSEAAQSGFMEDVVDSWSKMFILWRKEDRQVFRSQQTDVIKIFAYFWQKKGLFAAFPTDLEKFKGSLDFRLFPLLLCAHLQNTRFPLGHVSNSSARVHKYN